MPLIDESVKLVVETIEHRTLVCDYDGCGVEDSGLSTLN